MPQTEEERKQKKREYNKTYREKNKDYMKDYREKNKQTLKQYQKDYREKYTEQMKQYKQEYYQINQEYYKEYKKEYRKTLHGKKVLKIADWKRKGLKETDEKIEEIYELYTTIKYCEACDVKLTRTGKCSATDVNLDHCHTTGRFRFMLCHSCNTMDRWKQYFC
mgnify:CR=1 FL=1|tara:strand:- start:25 stop:516 length:492 start_codon:yes stop_codon:yes gene_type:complete